MKQTKFKQTEIGQIPEDWEVKTMTDVAVIARGGSPRPIQDYLTSSFDGVNWIKIGDVAVGAKYIEKTEERIIPEGVSRSRRVYAGDFLLSNSMSFGRPYILKIDGCIHDGWLVIQNYQDSFNTEFLYYMLNSAQVLNQYYSMAAGSSVLNLNKDIVAKVKVDIPSLEEQERIAEALSDADVLLRELDAEIAKKRAIKQGAMQELLTGKRRLEGFTGEWEEKKLGEVCRFQTGAPFDSKYFNSDRLGIRLIRNRDLKTDDQVVYYSGEFDSQFLVYNGDLLVGMDGDFLPCVWKKGEALLNQRVGRIIFDDGQCSMFYYYYLYKPLLEKQEGTGATTVKHLSHSDIVRMVMPIPNSLEEQTAIANILSDMDEEIAALEAKRAKYEQVKQGMMQELLTGRIRLT